MDAQVLIVPALHQGPMDALEPLLYQQHQHCGSCQQLLSVSRQKAESSTCTT